MTVLQGTDKNYPLTISLPLITALEEAHGSLYQIAEGLLDKSLPLSAMIDMLKIIYRHAGCEIADEFILQQPCTEILITVLLDILEPVERTASEK